MVGIANFLVFDDVHTVFASNAPWYDKALSAVSLAGDIIPVLKLAKAGRILEVAAKVAQACRADRAAWTANNSVKLALRAAYDAWKELCTPCFPAGTLVSTPKGQMPKGLSGSCGELHPRSGRPRRLRWHLWLTPMVRNGSPWL